PSLFSGYVSHAGTAGAVCDGWLNTGDIGYFDDYGNLYIAGRQDNMIITGSHNVYPEEIEEMIQSSGIVDDCLICSEHNKFYGESIVCFYVSEQDESDRLQSYCSSKLAAYEMPRIFIKVPEIPYTDNGKKIRDRKRIKEMLKWSFWQA
ncbi:MAG TPA: class I adenylate-forming enzyme family protein, partial [Clostridia bacterium]|nr:class I adenylate-forming enzyme family protein [Clostridia bacterium]